MSESIEAIECWLSIGFTTENEAKIAFNCLRIDSKVNSIDSFVVNNNYLEIHLKANRLKSMRVCLKSLLQSVDLLLQVMDTMGDQC